MTAREHIAAYVLASVADILLLTVLSQLGSRAGVRVDLVRLVALHELVLAILMVGVVYSGVVRSGWRCWQYVTTSILFSGYVGYRMATRFIAALELVGPLETKGVVASEYLSFFYSLSLGSTVCYMLMILVLRKAYGRLATARISVPRIQ